MAGHEKAAYMAGIMDGEGSFTVSVVSQQTKHKGVTHNFVLYVGFTMTDPRIARWAVENFGGSVYSQRYTNSKPWHKSAWRWRIATGKEKLEQFLLAMIPYLILKRKQAELLLDFIRLPHGATVEKIEILEQIHALNKRGKSPETNTPKTSDVVGKRAVSKLLTKAFMALEKAKKAGGNQAIAESDVKIESELTGNSKSDPVVIQ